MEVGFECRGCRAGMALADTWNIVSLGRRRTDYLIGR